jgi:hypothetical protein
MDTTISKANSMFGLIKRFTREFNYPYVCKSLYCSLVRSVIEYGSIIWMPQYDIDIRRIESLQKQFLIFCLRGLNWNHNYILPSYRSRLTLLHLLPLRDRQIINCCLFVYDMLKGNIASAALLSSFNFRNNPYSLRNFRSLEETRCRTNYCMNEPLNRCIRLFNGHNHIIDLNDSKRTLRHKLTQHYEKLESH